MATPAVPFVYADWVAAYPEFSACSSGQGQSWFNRAGLYFANETCNPAFVVGVALFAEILYMLTSHIAWLNAPRDSAGNPSSSGQQPSPLVGRINSASEGSVSVQAEWKGSGSPSEDWFTQTKYGAAFWQATAQFRTARYLPHPTVVVPSIFPFAPFPRRFY